MYTVYSKPNCTQCDAAKKLLQSKGLQYSEIFIDVGQQKLEGVLYAGQAEFKAANPHVKSVPYILFNEEPVGGYKALLLKLA
jgi:glutaredoxin 3